MAKREVDDELGETTSAYFRRIYGENPKWLKGRSNELILGRWLEDHQGYTQVPGNVRANLSNVKNILRKKKGKRGRPPADDLAIVFDEEITPVLPRVNVRGLESLEEQIDEGLSMAKTLGREALQDVIGMLRQARNEVILMRSRS